MSIHHKNSNLVITAEGYLAFDTSLTGMQDAMNPLPEADPVLLKRIPKMGNKTETFTRRALALASQNIGLLPRDFNLTEVEQELASRDLLVLRFLAMQRLTKRMQMAITLQGSDAYSAALAAYKAMRATCRDESLRAQLQELGRIFANAQAEQEEPEPEEGTPAA